MRLYEHPYSRNHRFFRSARSIFLIALLTAFLIAPASFAAGLTFSDVRETDWFADSVAEAVRLGLINGRGRDADGENFFDPDGNITLAEAVKLAACIRQLCTDGAVTLTNGDPWYESYADYGRRHFLSASDAGFSYESVMEKPDYVINRAEFAWLFARAAPYGVLAEINAVPDNAIPDVRNDWEYRSDMQGCLMRYYADIYRLYRAGIVNGSDKNGSFLPASPIRRSEVAAIAVRIMEPDRRVGPPEYLKSTAPPIYDADGWGRKLAALAASLPPDPDCPIGDFSACAASLDPAKAEAVVREAPETAVSFRAAFRRAFGVTPLAFQMQPQPDASSSADGGSLVFTGDICFADNWYSMAAYRERGYDITNNIPEPLLGILRDADVCVMNCEFSMSLRGAPLEGKAYTFRGDPANAKLFSVLGCDLVSLANNHVYDFGKDAFLDTLDALDEAGIARIGAGRTLNEAKEYRAFVAGGAKIGFVAASNAEVNRMTPGAAADTPGILLMYDPAEFCAALDRARAECDFVCAVVHWGTENSTEINRNQREYAALFAAHGTGLIVGHHPHVLQPVEETAGIPVAYSLGNFWFNLQTLDTGVLRVDLGWDDRKGVMPAVTLIPCVQSGGVTNVTDP